jgi:hypothetical protein
MRAWHRYAVNLLLAVDQAANAVTGGDPDETISSRASKSRGLGRRWARVLCWALDLVDPGHCDDHVEPDEGRHRVIDYQLPKGD